MLSDSLHEATEIIWQAIEHYEYSSEYEVELVESLTKLTYIIYKLDHLEHTWDEDDMKQHILKRYYEIKDKRNS
jgi:4-hydroxyphenylpyruvate dioxygenase-like putative hemolysin